MNLACRSVAGAILMLPLLACSDDGLNKSNLKKAIDATLGQKTCFALLDMNKPNVWPIRMAEGGLAGGAPRDLPPILADMQRAGYIQVQHTITQSGLLLQPVVVITPVGQTASWWDHQAGFCVGKQAVADVQKWTEPGKEAGTPIQVEYTWKLVDVPDWAQRPEFANIPGMRDPVPAVAIVRKANNGWVAE